MAYLQEIEIDWKTFKSVKTALSSSTLYYLQSDLQWTPFVITEGTSPVQAQTLYYCCINRDPKAVSGPYAPIVSGSKDTATIQSITWTACVYGTSGVTITYANDAPAVGQESVTVAGTAITVHIVSGQSTAQQVVTAALGWSAYNGNATFNSQAAAYLVSAKITPGQEGTPQTTQATTPLAGGTAAVTNYSDWVNNYMGTGTLVPSFSVGVGLEL